MIANACELSIHTTSQRTALAESMKDSVDTVLQAKEMYDASALGTEDTSGMGLVYHDVCTLFRNVLLDDPDNVRERSKVAVHAVRRFHGNEEGVLSLGDGGMFLESEVDHFFE